MDGTVFLAGMLRLTARGESAAQAAVPLAGGDPLCTAKQAEPSQKAGSGGGARVGTKEPDFPH